MPRPFAGYGCPRASREGEFQGRGSGGTGRALKLWRRRTTQTWIEESTGPAVRGQLPGLHQPRQQQGVGAKLIADQEHCLSPLLRSSSLLEGCPSPLMVQTIHCQRLPHRLDAVVDNEPPGLRYVSASRGSSAVDRVSTR